jgi:hypothetical protein
MKEILLGKLRDNGCCGSNSGGDKKMQSEVRWNGRGKRNVFRMGPCPRMPEVIPGYTHAYHEVRPDIACLISSEGATTLTNKYTIIGPSPGPSYATGIPTTSADGIPIFQLCGSDFPTRPGQIIACLLPPKSEIRRHRLASGGVGGKWGKVQ